MTGQYDFSRVLGICIVFLLKGHLGSHAYHTPNGIVFCKIDIVLFKGVKKDAAYHSSV